MIPQKLYGVILDIKPLGELDCTVMVFTESLGLISLIAKGVKKITSHRGFHLDLFNVAHFDVEAIGSNLQPRRYIREVSTVENFKALKRWPENFSAACVMATFLKRILPQSIPERQLFSLTEKTFKALNANCTPREILSAYFLRALHLLGHLPSLIKKREVKSILQQTLYELDPEFTLNARKTLGIFSKWERTASS
jgi:DNA repair protein RecO (recombination protein O)